MNTDYRVGDLIYDANMYDGLKMNRMEWHYFINGEFHSIQNMDMRLFFPQELDSYLKWAGFNIIHKFGSFEEEVFKDTSEKQIYVLTFNH